MEKMIVRGGHRLEGTVAAAGSKNAALPIMAACLLAEEPVTLHGIPQLADVDTLARVLGALGVTSQRLPSGDLCLATHDESRCEPPGELVRRMRASFCVLGPLVARRGRARVALPGGCRIGDRPVDLHLKGLCALGADIQIQGECVVARAGRLRGGPVDLRGPHGSTVTGTCNVMSAAVLATGHTLIEGAACEPEVTDLGRFLVALGADIRGLGTSRILVRGVAKLRGGSHRVIPDRIEAATLMIAAAMTRGRLTIRNVQRGHLSAVIARLRAIGVTVEGDRTSLVVHADRAFRSADITAAPYPGLPTDVQAQFTALLATVGGVSCVRDTVFPERFQHVAELRRMGARIVHEGNRAIVTGVPSLSGAHVTASDLRASAALVVAGLAAVGETTVHQIPHLDRGYEVLDAKLRALGACITRVAEETPVERRAA
jgi:UDP-N-acetylglucosamine 1-carboxyvinyltransferase